MFHTRTRAQRAQWLVGWLVRALKMDEWFFMSSARVKGAEGGVRVAAAAE